jgi:RNA polymerase sigma-70 factor (ECF subfamily)
MLLHPEPPRRPKATDDDGLRRLVARCTTDALDKGSWDELVRRYRPLVASVARSTLEAIGVKDPALVDDAISNVFSDLLANRGGSLRSFSWQCSFPGWLAVVARRQTKATLRRAKRSLAREELGTPPGELASPLDEAARSEVRTIVRRELAELPERDQLALKLHYEDGCSYAEVASVVGLPAAQVSSLMARARARLRAALERVLG